MGFSYHYGRNMPTSDTMSVIYVKLLCAIPIGIREEGFFVTLIFSLNDRIIKTKTMKTMNLDPYTLFSKYETF